MTSAHYRVDLIRPDEFTFRASEVTAALEALNEGFGRDRYGRAVHERRIAQHEALLAYVSDSDTSRVVGCAYVTKSHRIAACAVVPDLVGRGIGTLLVEALREHVWPMYVEVGQEAPRFTPVLEHAGFEVVMVEEHARLILRDLGAVDLRWLGDGTYTRDRVEGPGSRTFQLLVGGAVKSLLDARS